MVFKVQGNFNDKDFSKILSKCSEYFNIMYVNDNLYLALTNYRLATEARESLKKIFRPARNYLIIELDAIRLMREPNGIMEWCRDAFVALDIQKFEDNEQETLRRTLEDIDELERRLKALDYIDDDNVITTKDTKKDTTKDAKKDNTGPVTKKEPKRVKVKGVKKDKVVSNLNN